MAQLNKTSFENLYGTSGTTFPDNTTGEISEGDMRTFGDDIADSFLNRTDDLLDEDDMASDSDSKVPSQQSVKAFVLNQVGGIALTSVTVNVSSAEILALNSTPKEIIPAPGAGFFINLIKGFISYDYVSAAYANPAMALEYGSSQLHNSMPTMLAQTSDQITVVGAVSISTSLSNIENQNIRLRATSADPTTGDGTLKVKLIYRIETL